MVKRKRSPLPSVVHREVRSWLPLLAISFGLLAGMPVLMDADTRPTQQTEARKALEQRWSALIAQRANPDVVKWKSLEADFRAFAQKYDLHLEEHANRARPLPPGAPADAVFLACPPRDDVPGYRGYLFPGPKGVCRYICVPVVKE
jgi:hypothetical protein